MSYSEDSSADCAAQIHLREATVNNREKAKKLWRATDNWPKKEEDGSRPFPNIFVHKVRKDIHQKATMLW